MTFNKITLSKMALNSMIVIHIRPLNSVVWHLEEWQSPE